MLLYATCRHGPDFLRNQSVGSRTLGGVPPAAEVGLSGPRAGREGTGDHPVGGGAGRVGVSAELPSGYVVDASLGGYSAKVCVCVSLCVHACVHTCAIVKAALNPPVLTHKVIIPAYVFCCL